MISNTTAADGIFHKAQGIARSLGIDLDRQVGGPDDPNFQVVWMESFDEAIASKGVTQHPTLMGALLAIATEFQLSI